MDSFFLIIDGSSLLSTQFFGNLPKEILFAKTTEEKEQYYHKIMQNSKGVYTNAIYGFFRTLFKILREQKPTHLAVTWDVSRNTFRRQLYADYKAQRSETVKPLKDQFILCQRVLGEIGIKQLMDEQYEADDFSGTLAANFEQQLPVRILTKDNDYLQLITEQTHVWLIHGSAKKTEELFQKYRLDPKQLKLPDRIFEFTPELVLQEFGIKPASVPDLKGLQGDSSDNIKGVPGVGEKAAGALIARYETVEKLYDEIRDADEEKKAEISRMWKTELGLSRSPMPYLLKSSESELVGEKAAMLSTQLATIKKDVPLPEDRLSDYTISLNQDAIKRVLNELEFKSLLTELPGQESEIKKDIHCRKIADLNEAEEYFRHLCEKKKPCKTLAVSQLMDGNELYGFSFAAAGEEAVFIPLEGFITEALIAERIRTVLAQNTKLVAFNIKEIRVLVQEAKPEQCFDVEIAAYLINPLKGSYPYDAVALDYLGTPAATRNELPKNLSLAEAENLETEKVLSFCCAECITAIQVQPVLEQLLEKHGMTKLFREIEMPLLFTLSHMEQYGIKVDRGELKKYGQQLEAGIAAAEKEIYKEAGEEFNINSPKQLGVILFDKLMLPHGKKTKSGYSTAVEILEKLSDDYAIVRQILEYRTLTKLKSTYADGLMLTVEKDERIRSRFHQTVTATGRLSSTEPNLQNIPIRMELGRSIRKVFVPEKGFVFVDADYSQIELRILAAMSKDENLIDAYRNKMDIHRLTASQVFHIPFDQVTPEQRSNAKAVNFGIVYGISSFGLGQGLNISRKEADRYITKYFETYPVIKEFLDSLVEEGRREGAVKTLYGRLRPIPELSSSNFMQRSFGERIAMNSPIQGTAADIIKIAMIAVDRRLQKETEKSRLILQIHDELLIEAAIEEKDTVKRILQEEMEHAATLLVPLEVEVKEGENWYEAK